MATWQIQEQMLYMFTANYCQVYAMNEDWLVMLKLVQWFNVH